MRPGKLRITWRGLSSFSPSSCDGKRRRVCFCSGTFRTCHASSLVRCCSKELRRMRDSDETGKLSVVPRWPVSWSSDKAGAEAKHLVDVRRPQFLFLYVTSKRPNCLTEHSSHGMHSMCECLWPDMLMFWRSCKLICMLNPVIFQ